jgi:ABC-type lipoprotein export system ATPase subunit
MDINISKVKVKIGAGQRPLFHIPKLEIKGGEKILIKGASGTGKTTFLHLLSGLFSPNEGSIVIGETDLASLSEEHRTVFRRKNIGIVFQKLNLIEHLTAIENIELALTAGADLKKAGVALKAVGLSGREHDRTSVMSLGEQQRVAIARVMAGNAQLVFADEPTSSLDEKNAFQALELLLKACEKKTLIVVSHDHRIEKYFSKIIDFNEWCE